MSNLPEGITQTMIDQCGRCYVCGDELSEDCLIIDDPDFENGEVSGEFCDEYCMADAACVVAERDAYDNGVPVYGWRGHHYFTMVSGNGRAA